MLKMDAVERKDNITNRQNLLERIEAARQEYLGLIEELASTQRATDQIHREQGHADGQPVAPKRSALVISDLDVQTALGKHGVTLDL